MDEEKTYRLRRLHFRRRMGFLGRNKLRAVLALTVVVAGCSSQPRDAGQVEADRVNCQRQIRSVAYCVFQYLSDHDGQFPKTLEDAVGCEVGEDIAQRFIQCPAKGSVAKYIYVDWSRWFTNACVPKDYPLVYESKRNQHGNGINVVLMDGSVFWDEGVRWLSEFIKKHPEYGLEMPQ